MLRLLDILFNDKFRHEYYENRLNEINRNIIFFGTNSSLKKNRAQFCENHPPLGHLESGGGVPRRGRERPEPDRQISRVFQRGERAALADGMRARRVPASPRRIARYICYGYIRVLARANTRSVSG